MEGKTLKRKWAQISIMLFCLGVGIDLLSSLFTSREQQEFGLFVSAVQYTAGGMILMGLLFWPLMARCPHCGKRCRIPTWVYRKEYCARCGHVLPFDDGPLHEEELPLNRRGRVQLGRGWARLTLALFAVGFVCGAGGILTLILLVPRPQSADEFWALYETIQSIRDAGLYMFVTGCALLAAAVSVSRHLLRCPCCGEGAASPLQRRGQTRWCRGCGAALSFAGELEYESSV